MRTINVLAQSQAYHYLNKDIFTLPAGPQVLKLHLLLTIL